MLYKLVSCTSSCIIQSLSGYAFSYWGCNAILLVWLGCLYMKSFPVLGGLPQFGLQVIAECAMVLHCWRHPASWVQVGAHGLHSVPESFHYRHNPVGLE